MFGNKTLLITGGTGSFGHAVMKRFLDTDIKEIARGNIALVYLIDGKIQWKRTLSSIDASLFMNEQEEDAFNAHYINNHMQFFVITIVHVVALVLLLLIDYFRLIVKQFLFRNTRKRV